MLIYFWSAVFVTNWDALSLFKGLGVQEVAEEDD
jgi:hypothetical protein